MYVCICTYIYEDHKGGAEGIAHDVQIHTPLIQIFVLSRRRRIPLTTIRMFIIFVFVAVCVVLVRMPVSVSFVSMPVAVMFVSMPVSMSTALEIK